MKFKSILKIELKIPEDKEKEIQNLSLDAQYDLIKTHFEDLEKAIRGYFIYETEETLSILGNTKLKIK